VDKNIPFVFSFERHELMNHHENQQIQPIFEALKEKPFMIPKKT